MEDRDGKQRAAEVRDTEDQKLVEGMNRATI